MSSFNTLNAMGILHYISFSKDKYFTTNHILINLG